MTDTLQIDLGGGASIALPADKVTTALIARLQSQAASRPNRYALGQYLPNLGGHFAGDILGDDGVTYGLIAARNDAGRGKWGPDGARSDLSDWDGLANTAILQDGDHPAAQLAASYEADDVTGFYLPARRELIIAQANIPHLFEKSGWYQTSTPCGSTPAWVVDFEYGNVVIGLRRDEWQVRPFRRFTY